MRKTRFGLMLLLLFGIEPSIVSAQTILDGAGLSVRGGAISTGGILSMDDIRHNTIPIALWMGDQFGHLQSCDISGNRYLSRMI